MYRDGVDYIRLLFLFEIMITCDDFRLHNQWLMEVFLVFCCCQFNFDRSINSDIKLLIVTSFFFSFHCIINTLRKFLYVCVHCHLRWIFLTFLFELRKYLCLCYKTKDINLSIKKDTFFLPQFTQWLTRHALIYYILCYNGSQADFKHTVLS